MTSSNNVIRFMRKPFAVLAATAGLSVVATPVFFFVKRQLCNKRNIEKNGSDGVSEKQDGGIQPALDDRVWFETGCIKELYYYPLKSGRGKAIESCNFTDYGISVEMDGLITLRDRMLLVYDGKTGKFKTGRNYSKLVLVSIFGVDEKHVKLEADGMESIVIRLPDMDHDESKARVECSMWWGERLTCIDCGSGPAEWISRFLTGGTESDLRIGSAISKRRNIHEGPWEKFTKVYRTLRNEDTGYFADIASYMLMSESSLDELNQRLNKPVSALQFRPNIVVTGCKPFDEDSWEWIKIGDSVLIRNFKPCSRCAMIRVDPDFGTVDQHEPSKTLRSFHEQTDPKRIEVDGKAPIMGIYCGLYSSGRVKIGDKVFIRRVTK